MHLKPSLCTVFCYMNFKENWIDDNENASNIPPFVAFKSLFLQDLKVHFFLS